MVQWVGLQCVIMAFPGHTHFFLVRSVDKIPSILFKYSDCGTTPGSVKSIRELNMDTWLCDVLLVTAG